MFYVCKINAGNGDISGIEELRDSANCRLFLEKLKRFLGPLFPEYLEYITDFKIDEFFGHPGNLVKLKEAISNFYEEGIAFYKRIGQNSFGFELQYEDLIDRLKEISRKYSYKVGRDISLVLSNESRIPSGSKNIYKSCLELIKTIFPKEALSILDSINIYKGDYKKALKYWIELSGQKDLKYIEGKILEKFSNGEIDFEAFGISYYEFIETLRILELEYFE